MSRKHVRAEPNEIKAPQSKTYDTVHADGLPAHWSSRRRRDGWFLLVVLLLGMGTILVLSHVGTLSQKQSNGSPPAPLPTSTTSATPAATARVIVRVAQVHLFPFPPSNVGLMQPAVDAQGNVWVGEMSANRLARLASHTGVVTTWKPPNGKYGIMTTAVDTKGKVWFVEQGANYIGRFDPATQTFRSFPLGIVNGHPLGPQDLQFDTRGQLWFTALLGGRIGRLDPATGAVQTWPVPSPNPATPATPFSLTVTPDEQVWFGDITGGAVGHLNPATGRVTLYHLANSQAEVFAMAHDSGGHIWFTEIGPGRLGKIDTTTNSVAELPVPTLFGKPAALYGLVVTHDGNVWFVNNGADVLGRYAPGKVAYTFFQLALPSSGPFGLTLDAAGKLWFTADGPSANYVGAVTP